MYIYNVDIVLIIFFVYVHKSYLETIPLTVAPLHLVKKKEKQIHLQVTAE